MRARESTEKSDGVTRAGGDEDYAADRSDELRRSLVRHWRGGEIEIRVSLPKTKTLFLLLSVLL